MNSFLSKPKAFFTLIGIVYGFIFVGIIPPGQVPDEPNHFYKAYQVSDGQWTAQAINHRLGGSIPKSAKTFFYSFRKLRYHYDQRVYKTDWKLATPLQSNNTTFQDFPNTAIYTPMGYLIQAFAIQIGKQFNWPIIYIFYLARLLSLLAWIVFIRIAIDWLPYGKWILGILALLPSSLWIHCGVTADTMTNGISFLLIALILKLIYKKKEKFDFVLLGVFSLILSVTKIVYFPIFFLAFLIPSNVFSKNRQKTTRNKYIFLGLLTALNLLVISYLLIKTKAQFITYEDYNPSFRIGQQINEGSNPSQQLDYVMDHPFAFAKNIIHSYTNSLQATLAHYFGKFGWEKNYLPSWLIGLLLLSTSLLGFATSKPKSSSLVAMVFVGLGITMMVGFATITYIQWSPVGSSTVLNLAGRYMIPIFPLFYLILPNLLSKYQKPILTFAQIMVLISLSVGIWSILDRYYL